MDKSDKNLWPVTAAGAMFLCLTFGAHASFAEDIVAKSSGLMCRSATALADLTLKDGSDRSVSSFARPGDAVEKATGGCLAVVRGLHLSAVVKRKNTTIVLYDPGNGGGPQSFYVANIDFAAPAGSAGATAAATPPSQAPAPALPVATTAPPAPQGPPGSDAISQIPVLTPLDVAFAYNKLLGTIPDFKAYVQNTASFQQGSCDVADKCENSGG